MLSKLLKYEIKATGRIFLPFFLSLLVFAGITKFISILGPQKWDTPAIISMIIYIIIMVGMFIMTFTVMIQRFYRNLLSDEGYLMFTLPTKPWKNIASKLLISMLWMLASVIVAIISILIIAYEKGIITEITKGFATFINQIIEQLGTSAYLLTFEIILATFLSLASGILIIYASIAIGHLFNQHKMLASFGAFIVLNTLTQILFMLVSLFRANLNNVQISSINDLVALHSAIQTVIGYGIIFTALQCTAYFAITNIILSKRLNLE